MAFLPEAGWMHEQYMLDHKDGMLTSFEGGAETIVEAFIEYFGKKGLVVFPATSWKLGYLVDKDGNSRDPSLGKIEGFTEFGNHFDVKTTPCHGLGIIPEIFRTYPGVVRSICPTSSVCAYGPDAADFCSGHEKAETPLNWNSPWGKLYDRKAKIIFLGTTMRCNTFMHVLEEYAGVPNILAPYIWKYTVTDYSGNTYPIEFRRHEPEHNAYYLKVQQELIDNGVAKEVKFGSANCQLVDVVKETKYMLKRLKEEPTLFCHEYN
ncbi:MAG: AAC(3) family N-acetyltransferase [Ruminococcaceae bacterium]|nr:AAC(3) family N-acetyltransferase [Oscillospiraceae bacterium]